LFLIAFHFPFIAAMPFVAIPRHDLGVAQAAVVVLLALAIGGLQLRHSLVLVRGERPVGGLWTWLAMVPLAYVPLWWFTWDWVAMQWFVAASGLMVLPRLPGAIAAAAPTVGTSAVAAWYAGKEPGFGLSGASAVTAYYLLMMTMGTVGLYAAPWLVRVLEDLSRARTEQAELAVGRERLRVSRDLHDLLGQSLSAVSLKGDLALRLLPTDTAAARAEIEDLTVVARDALRDMRAVARDEHGVSLPTELESAATLLEAAGVRADVDVELGVVAGPTEPVLAWAVRESATNTLRHSAATTWQVAARRWQGTIELEIVNDGVAPAGDGDRHADGAGIGLAGLRQRAEALSGTLAAGSTADGRFRLRIEIPEAAP
jgi:two-component system sensor histidine kinase DesK